jgi:hypothetical protein
MVGLANHRSSGANKHCTNRLDNRSYGQGRTKLMDTIEVLEQWRSLTRKMLRCKPFSTKWKQLDMHRSAYETILEQRWGLNTHETKLRILNQSETVQMLKDSVK